MHSEPGCQWPWLSFGSLGVMSKKVPIIVGLILAGLVISFVLMPGGSALAGKAASGHYYLGSHGHFREVSQRIYVLSALLSTAIGLVLPVYATVFTMWRESSKPTGNRWLWLGPLFALLLGLTLSFSSIQRITWAETPNTALEPTATAP